MKNILILYTSVGLGHKFIAENIGYHLEQTGYRVKLHDVLQLQEGLLVDFGTWLHNLINRRFPFIWRWLYFSKLVNFIGLPLRAPLANGNCKNILKVVEEFKPNMIITTQVTASAAVSSLKKQGKFSGKFVIAFSDYHLHRFWLYDQADFYLANIEEQKQEMVVLGIPENKIEVLGITLKPFIETDKQRLKTELGIPQDSKVILFGSGSLGIGFPFEILKSYLNKLVQQPNVSVIVLCGKNQQFKQDIDDLNLNNVLALPFTDKIKEIYQISDLFLTKPGGLTIAEVLQAGTNILITHTLPGQEEPNYDYLLKNNLIKPRPDPLNVENLIKLTKQYLNSSETFGETLESYRITQKNHEGEILKKTINKLFHSV